MTNQGRSRLSALRHALAECDSATVSRSGAAVALRAACRRAHAHALDSILASASASAPEALVWVVCEMGWADQDLGDAGVPATRIMRSDATASPSMTELLLKVVTYARAAVDTEVDERVRSTSIDAAARADACLAVMPTSLELAYAQEMGGAGLDVRGALRSRPAS